METTEVLLTPVLGPDLLPHQPPPHAFLLLTWDSSNTRGQATYSRSQGTYARSKATHAGSQTTYTRSQATSSCKEREKDWGFSSGGEVVERAS